MNSTDQVVDQQERLQREVIATEQRLESLRNESKRADQGLDNLSNSARNTADAMEEAEKSSLSFGDVVGGNLVAGALQSAIDGLRGVIEESKEYRKIMGSLEVSSKNAGYTAEETAETYKELFGVLGDNQTAATTTSNLQALGLEQKELNKLIFYQINYILLILIILSLLLLIELFLQLILLTNIEISLYFKMLLY